MGTRFNVVPICSINSHFVAVCSSVPHGIVRDICPEFDAGKKEFMGQNRETHWKNIFDFKRLNTGKKGYSRGPSEAMGQPCVSTTGG